MSRPLRIEFPGAVYHLTSRGNARADIFLDAKDRRAFLDVLDTVVGRLGWRVFAYCLMANHYHLLVETPGGDLSRGMRQLNGVYTQRVNRRHDRVGHLFQGRYKAILVDRDAHLLEAARYIVLNPVRAGVAEDVRQSHWTSYPATAGAEKPPPWLDVDGLLSMFAEAPATARATYEAFVAEGADKDLWANLTAQVFLGDDDFASSALKLSGGATQDREVPRAQRRNLTASLGEIAARTPGRDDAIREAWRSGAFTLADIGRHFGLHYSWVSRIARAKSKT